MSGLIAQAQQLIQQITTDKTNGWGTDVTFTTPDGGIEKTVTAIAVKHSLAFDGNGIAMTMPTSRVTVSEDALLAVDYPVRDSNDNVALLNHRVTWTDVENVTRTYIINKIFPDSTIGLIVCQLGNYQS